MEVVFDAGRLDGVVLSWRTTIGGWGSTEWRFEWWDGGSVGEWSDVVGGLTWKYMICFPGIFLKVDPLQSSLARAS